MKLIRIHIILIITLSFSYGEKNNLRMKTTPIPSPTKSFCQIQKTSTIHSNPNFFLGLSIIFLHLKSPSSRENYEKDIVNNKFYCHC